MAADRRRRRTRRNTTQVCAFWHVGLAVRGRLCLLQQLEQLCDVQGVCLGRQVQPRSGAKPTGTA